MSDKFDGLFMTAVQQAQGIENFFDALFGFFGRKTDLFEKEDTAVSMVTGNLHKHIAIFKENVAKKAAMEEKRKAA